MSFNRDLNKAKRGRNDDFYTQLTDIEKELRHYANYFRKGGKVVYCNCDDPKVSNFFQYFWRNFRHFRLSKLIATCYKNQNPGIFSLQGNEKAVGLIVTESPDSGPDLPNIRIFNLGGDGDFRSDECVELLNEADVVVTNPPFSLFREYIGQLVDYDKDFIIVGNMNAITYKDVFPLIKGQKIWLGSSIKSGDREFGVPDHYPLEAANNRVDENGNKFVRVKGVRWFTNLDHVRRHEKLILYKPYSPERYPNYDNYHAIEVGRVADIPCDYDGEMGVPLSFLDKHNPDQFEILGMDADFLAMHKGGWSSRFYLSGRRKYARIVIRKRSCFHEN